MGTPSRHLLKPSGIAVQEPIGRPAPGPKGVLLSLVIPVYNSAQFIEANLRNAAAYLGLMGGPCELVVVDDASTDGTQEVLKTLQGRLDDVTLVTLFNNSNQGKGYSVRRGMSVAQGSYLVFNDADFTYPVSEVGKVTSYLEDGADLVIGCRVHPDSRYEIGPEFFSYFFTRHLMSRTFNQIVNWTLGLSIRDTQAGIKGFRREVAQRIFEHQRLNRFSFDLELLFLARKQGLKIEEIPIRFLYRKEPTTVRFVQDSLRILWDIVRIRWRSLTGRYEV